MSTTTVQAEATGHTCGLTDNQLKTLFQQVNARRVGQLRGMAHMEAWDIRRQLIRVFGFGGWDFEVISCDLVREAGQEKSGKKGPYTAWTVVYRVVGRLRIRCVCGRLLAAYEDGAAGDSVNQPSLGDAHDMALKTAMSQALKRCAVNLGDGFGLSLYNDGSTAAVVVWSAPHTPPADASTAPEDPPVQPEPAPAPPQQLDVDEPGPAAGPPQPVAAEDPDERDAALAAMWDAAKEVGFVDGLPAQFQQSFGHPIDQGIAAEFRQAHELMLGTAAA